MGHDDVTVLDVHPALRARPGHRQVRDHQAVFVPRLYPELVDPAARLVVVFDVGQEAVVTFRFVGLQDAMDVGGLAGEGSPAKEAYVADGQPTPCQGVALQPVDAAVRLVADNQQAALDVPEITLVVLHRVTEVRLVAGIALIGGVLCPRPVEPAAAGGEAQAGVVDDEHGFPVAMIVAAVDDDVDRIGIDG